MVSLTEKDWLVYIKKNDNAKIRLFFFPYAGGSASTFYQYREHFPDDDLEIIAIQYPGRGRRFSEQPLKHWSDLVEQIRRSMEAYLEKDFILFGHSLGAKIAYQIAKHLEKRGKYTAHLIVSGARAPHCAPNSPIYDLPDLEFIEEIRKNNGTPEEVLCDLELMKLVMPSLRADYEIADTMPLEPINAPISCNITVFTGTADVHVSSNEAQAWRIHTSAEFVLHTVKGDHFFIHSSQNEVFAKINDLLAETRSRLQSI